jgi:hypothetical protein
MRSESRTTLRMIAVGVVCGLVVYGPDVTAQPSLSANGVVCDNGQAGTNSFSFTELGPSTLGANATRLEKVRRMAGYFKAIEPLCRGQRFPGCEAVLAWHNRQLVPWPTTPDPDYLAKRVRLLQGDDDMLVEVTRVLGHSACQSQIPKISDACTALVAAEEKASPDVSARVDAVIKCFANQPKQPPPAPDPKTKPATDPQKRALAFYASYALWRSGGSENICAPALTEADRQAAEKSADDAANAASDSVAKYRAALRAIAAAQAKADAIRNGTAAQKMAAAAATKAAQEAAVKAENVAGEAVKKADQLRKAHLEMTPNIPAGDPTNLEATNAFGESPETERYRWNPASTEVGRAAAAATTIKPSSSGSVAPRSGSEEGALLRNLVSCQNATFYVSPTRELVRHTLDNEVGNQISVCVDTSGFAVDQPIQVMVTTPSAQRVYGLWPGEPQVLPLETTFGETQVAHLTISGYPRREVLRALAKHVNGPLSGRDAFDLLAKAEKLGVTADTASATTKVLDKLSTTLAKNLPVSAALFDLSSEADKITSGHGDRSKLKALAEVAFTVLRKAVKDDPAYQDPGAQKALDALFPPVTDPPPDGPVKPSVTAIEKSSNDLTNIVKTLTSFLPNLNAKVLALKSSSQSDSDTKDDLGTAARIMCALTSEVVPLVVEDVLVLGCNDGSCRDPSPYLIQYDFTGGFERTNQGRPLKDKDKIFVEVQGVRPGWSIGAAINNRSVVQRNMALVGLSQTDTEQFSFSDQTSQSASGFNALKPLDLDVQAASTQIIALGSLSGSARYVFQVCASSSATDDCTAPVPPPSPQASPPAAAATAAPSASTTLAIAAPVAGAAPPATQTGAQPAVSAAAVSTTSTTTPKTTVAAPVPIAHRTIALNSLVVHSYRHLGVRAGVGVAESFSVKDNYRDLVPIAGNSASGVRSLDRDTQFGVPLLLTYYLGEGRDPTDLPHGFTGGFVGGIDVLNAFTHPRVYLGGVVDWSGFGLVVAASLESVATISNPSGSVVDPSAVQSDTVWLPGFLVGLTTDVDIFEAVFNAYFGSNQLPTIAASSSSSAN